MRNRFRRLLLVFLGFFLLIVALLFPGLPWSARLRHNLSKVIVKAEMRLARWRGSEPRLASVVGRLKTQGAKVEALDSVSGWATLADSEGRFVLPDVLWYPGASYNFIITTDIHNVRLITMTAPENFPEGGRLDLGEIDSDKGCEIDVVGLPGTNSISYIDLDAGNAQYYKSVFDKITLGLDSDAEKLDAINKFVAMKLNYAEQGEGFDSPRQILERGSRYCGDLSFLMATIADAGNYKTRMVDLSDGTATPSTHVVVEIFYEDAWHLFDPTFGVFFRNKAGQVASYKEMRLNPGLITRDAYQALGPKTVKWLLDWVPDVYRSGFHHYYFLKKKKPSCILWWPLPQASDDSGSTAPGSEAERAGSDRWNLPDKARQAERKKPKMCRRCDAAPIILPVS